MEISQEKKLGRAILEITAEITQTPQNNVKRFLILERNLKRAVKAYREYTGSDYLLGKSAAYYSMEPVVGKAELELREQENTRRNGTEPE